MHKDSLIRLNDDIHHPARAADKDITAGHGSVKRCGQGSRQKLYSLKAKQENNLPGLDDSSKHLPLLEVVKGNNVMGAGLGGIAAKCFQEKHVLKGWQPARYPPGQDQKHCVWWWQAFSTVGKHEASEIFSSCGVSSLVL